jgi:hypothetical protein
MGERIRKYGTGFSPVARWGSVGVDTKDASRGRVLPIADRQGPASLRRSTSDENCQQSVFIPSTLLVEILPLPNRCGRIFR